MSIPNNDSPHHQKLAFLIIAGSSTDQRAMMTCLMAQFNGEVSSVTMTEALELTANQRFDLILINLGVSGNEGLEAVQKIRQAGANQQTPLVAISGLPNAAKRWVEAEVDAWLLKPFTPLELEATIKRLLNHADNQAD